jgi:hypothetical protein
MAAARFALSAAVLTQLAPASPPAALRSATRSLARWLTLGALAGGALVAAYLAGRADASRATVSVPTTAALMTPQAPPAVSVSSAPPSSAEAPPLAPRRVAARPSAASSPSTPPARSSTPLGVAEEVARLDAARTALAIGDFDGVARVLSRYEADFPRGVLAREADVVAISALRERGDRAGAMRRARRFLAQYPQDVHAPRVKQLVSWEALPADELHFP